MKENNARVHEQGLDEGFELHSMVEARDLRLRVKELEIECLKNETYRKLLDSQKQLALSTADVFVAVSCNYDVEVCGIVPDFTVHSGKLKFHLASFQEAGVRVIVGDLQFVLSVEENIHFFAENVDTGLVDEYRVFVSLDRQDATDWAHNR